MLARFMGKLTENWINVVMKVVILLQDFKLQSTMLVVEACLKLVGSNVVAVHSCCTNNSIVHSLPVTATSSAFALGGQIVE
jgi:hypothetical protein